jgi:hypothetical protein
MDPIPFWEADSRSTIKGKVNVELSPRLTEHHSTKIISCLIKHYAMKTHILLN